MLDYEYQQIYNTPAYNTSHNATYMGEGVAIWCLFAIIIAIVGGILTYFLFVKNSTEPKGKFAKWLKKFLDFKIMWIEPILKIVYYFATIFMVLFSFSFLSMGFEGVIIFLIVLIFGPIAVRLVYEALIMFTTIWRNTRDIAENTKKK